LERRAWEWCGSGCPGELAAVSRCAGRGGRPGEEYPSHLSARTRDRGLSQRRRGKCRSPGPIARGVEHFLGRVSRPASFPSAVPDGRPPPEAAPEDTDAKKRGKTQLLRRPTLEAAPNQKPPGWTFVRCCDVGLDGHPMDRFLVHSCTRRRGEKKHALSTSSGRCVLAVTGRIAVGSAKSNGGRTERREGHQGEVTGAQQGDNLAGDGRRKEQYPSGQRAQRCPARETSQCRPLCGHDAGREIAR
jgi:hypothetical protein